MYQEVESVVFQASPLKRDTISIHPKNSFQYLKYSVIFILYSVIKQCAARNLQHPGHHTLWLQLDSAKLASQCYLRSWVGTLLKNLSPLLVSSFCKCLYLNILFRFITLSWHLLNVRKSLFIVMFVNTCWSFYSQNHGKESPNLLCNIASWVSRKNLVLYQDNIPYFWM